MLTLDDVRGPHRGQPVRLSGSSLESATAAMVMVHGRGASAADILSLTSEFNEPHFAFVAPEAAGSTWYPNSFLAPIASNEPYLSSALNVLQVLREQIEAAGIPRERTMLLGFSQGACLSLEFVARNAGRYGGVAGLSGGVIGPDDTPRDYPGSFDGTPIFLGCSDIDFHIPKERVEESAVVFEQLGAIVDMRLYPGMGHTINGDEIEAVRQLMRRVQAVEQ